MKNSTQIGFELQNCFDVMPDLMCVTNMQGQFVHLNKAWNKVVEKPENERTDKSLIDFVHQEDHQKIIDRLQSLKSGIATGPIVVRIQFNIAGYRFIEWRTTCLNGSVFWISRDITSDIESQKKMQNIVIASEEFLDMLPEEIDYQKIADQLSEISGAKYVIVNIFEENGQDYTTHAVAGFKDAVRKATKFLGFPLIGKKWPYDPIRYERTREQSITRFENLKDFAGHALPDVVIRLIQSTFNIGDVLLAKIEKEGIVLGDFTMIMQSGDKFNQPTLVNIYTRQVGLLITRHKAELTLRESEAKYRDGKVIVVLENVIGEFDEHDELVRLRGYLIDITDRKLAENKLRESERLLKESQQISGIGSYVLDIRSGIWNGSVVLDNMFGIDAEDDHSVEGWLSVILPDDREMMDRYFAHDVLEMRGRFDKEYRILPKNGRPEFWVHGIGELEFDQFDVPVKMIGTIQDITRQKLINQALLQAKERAEASDRLKTTFLNNISHEVRTPLNGILGFGEMIAEPGLTPEKKAVYLKILNTSSGRLLNTINDYMDISLISSGNMEVRSSLFNLNDLIN